MRNIILIWSFYPKIDCVSFIPGFTRKSSNKVFLNYFHETVQKWEITKVQLGLVLCAITQKLWGFAVPLYYNIINVSFSFSIRQLQLCCNDNRFELSVHIRTTVKVETLFKIKRRWILEMHPPPSFYLNFLPHVRLRPFSRMEH